MYCQALRDDFASEPQYGAGILIGYWPYAKFYTYIHGNGMPLYLADTNGDSYYNGDAAGVEEYVEKSVTRTRIVTDCPVALQAVDREGTVWADS